MDSGNSLVSFPVNKILVLWRREIIRDKKLRIALRFNKMRSDMKTRYYLFAIICFVYSVTAQERFKEVSLPNTRHHFMTSTAVNDTFHIQVSLPSNYNSSSKFFPVLCVLDADKSFGMASDIVNWLSWAREIPQMIVVGISYGGTSKDWWTKRSRDYVPTKDKAKTWGEFPSAGGAKNFLSFLEGELFPFIGKNYRIEQKEKILAGLSFGGLFAVYSLFNKPQLFSKYIISGPALLWDNKIIFNDESEFAQKNDSLNAKIYCAVGELDEEKIITPWQEFVTLLEKRNYKGLNFFSEKLKGETHISAWPVSLTRGLKFLYLKK
jgi:predicted alpha/beta superfamily hydrolase